MAVAVRLVFRFISSFISLRRLLVKGNSSLEPVQATLEWKTGIIEPSKGEMNGYGCCRGLGPSAIAQAELHATFMRWLRKHHAG
jgi:hypothetical protein